MRAASLLIPICMMLSACASSQKLEKDCTGIISLGGSVLQFCQSQNQLDISEVGVDPRQAADEVRIIDDPNALHALQANLRLRPDLKVSRRIIAKACTVKEQTFVTVNLKDLARMINGNHLTPPEESTH